MMSKKMDNLLGDVWATIRPGHLIQVQDWLYETDAGEIKLELLELTNAHLDSANQIETSDVDGNNSTEVFLCSRHEEVSVSMKKRIWAKLLSGGKGFVENGTNKIHCGFGG